MCSVIVLGTLIGFSTGSALGDWITGYRSASLLSAGNLRASLSLLLMALLLAVVLTYFFYSRGVIADREAAAQSAQRQAAESQLKLLESQLEPHMLFNTLANLRALIALDPRRAEAMLDQLIGFLRATLNGSRSAQHSLRAEFARLADYLSLMQVRMADRLNVHFDLPAALAETPIAPLLLQPLVENSIKHGLEPAVAGGRIDISAARDGAELVLRVRDTGLGFDAGADGFGLSQVRERLATLYGARASLEIVTAPDADGGTLAAIRLPLPDA
jgi:LytS/YehU family sensor histidine kinase